MRTKSAALAILTAAAGLALVAGCGEDTVTAPRSTGQQTGDDSTATSGGEGTAGASADADEPAMVASVEVGDVADGQQTVRVRFIPRQESLGAYQAALRFDPGLASLREIETPGAGFHAVNDGEKADGRVRFAGFRAQGFESPPELVLSFRVSEALEPGDIGLRLETAGTRVAAEIPIDRVRVDGARRLESPAGDEGEFPAEETP